MAMSYDKLGLLDLRDDAERVLVTNFPDTQYKLGTNPHKQWWQIWNTN
jgi:outer membrane protein assembly factor BamD